MIKKKNRETATSVFSISFTFTSPTLVLPHGYVLAKSTEKDTAYKDAVFCFIRKVNRKSKSSIDSVHSTPPFWLSEDVYCSFLNGKYQ